MVVCKCRKATKLYCFVHRTPVCFDCICSPDHSHCVVWQYSDWVNDGDYDWPQRCAVCKESLEDSDKDTIRLGCLHVPHSECLKKHLESFPAHTAPAGFICPTQECGLEVWPPRNQKEAATNLYANLRSLISQTSVSDKILSAIINPSAAPPPPTDTSSAASLSRGSTVTEIVPAPDAALQAGAPAGKAAEARNGIEATGAASAGGGAGAAATAQLQGGALQPSGRIQSGQPQAPSPPPPSSLGSMNVARSRMGHTERVASADVAVQMDGAAYETDEEGGDKKYARRANTQSAWMGSLNPFAPQPRLPVSRRGEEEGAVEARGHRRRVQRRGVFSDPRRLLLAVAVGSCVATMFVLYFRLAQSIATAGDSSTFIPEG